MDLYRREQRLSNAENLIRCSEILSQKVKDTLFKYEQYLFSQGNSKLRIEKNLRVLRLAAERLDDFDTVTRETLEEFYAFINRQDRSNWNKRDYYIILRKFYRWFGHGDMFKGMKTVRGKSKVPQLLSQGEIEQIVRRTSHPRDKAMIYGLYDLGGRVSEWFSDLKIGDFIFEDRITEEFVEVSQGLYQKVHVKSKTCFVSVTGKTGNRTVELADSVGYIQDWIRSHPCKNDSYSNMWTDDNGIMLFTSYEQVVAHIRKLVSAAGINKHIVLYSFRHSRMTALDSALRETYLKKRHGTAQLKTYLHGSI